MNNTDLNSLEAINNEIYVKVYEDEAGITMENKTYTLDEYLIEKSKPELKGTIITIRTTRKTGGLLYAYTALLLAVLLARRTIFQPYIFTDYP